MRIFTKLVILSAAERLLLLRAWCALLGFRLALLLVPLPRLKAFLGAVTPRKLGKWATSTTVSPAQIARSLATARRLVPRSTCLVQALAADFLLRRENHPAQLHVGVVKKGGQLMAHAWVESGGETVVGGGESGHFTPILHWENG